MSTNLKDKIESLFPAELTAFLREAGSDAAAAGQPLYLAGGAVRDLLLGQSSFDLDLVIEGDAIALARKLATAEGSRVTLHPRFQTARLLWRRCQIDIARARTETYAHPGALPTVRPGDMAADLARRDFSINAMAIDLAPARFGALLDRHNGQADLKQKKIRVLHENSFIDDATRIWRALRYEQRLGFKLEENTRQLLERDIAYLGTISGDRIRYELECVLREAAPEAILSRAGETGALARLSAALENGAALARRFAAARRESAPVAPSFGLYLGLLTYGLAATEKARLAAFLHLDKRREQLLGDMTALSDKLPALSRPGLSPYQVYRECRGLSPEAIQAFGIAAENETVSAYLRLYLDKLRYVTTRLNGDDLKNMGLAAGPRMKEVLERLLQARLDGEIIQRQEEETLARRLVAEENA